MQEEKSVNQGNVESKPGASINIKPQVEQLVKEVMPKTQFTKNKLILSLIVVVALGVASGWFLSERTSATNIAPEKIATVNEAGVADDDTFKDSAEGVLEEGGIDGEGTHHLVRDGGPSKYVYLTSTVIDLSQFQGKRVKVWGETTTGKKAGWLMDVGRIRVVQ